MPQNHFYKKSQKFQNAKLLADRTSLCPRRQKYTSCTDNHGIRPPPPEQYLTPLQQKEVCIRHLRAKLKETINTLQDRDTEIDELRTQLYRMQEDWVEEECHRVEAQLALNEARQEIQQLKQAVDTVRSRLSDAGGLSGDVGVQKYFQDINTQNHKLENLLLSMELAQAGLAKEGEAIKASVSGESPGARSLTRSSTYTKLSDQALGDRNCNDTDFPCLSGDGTQDSGFVCCGENSVPSRADLLLEASLPHTFSHTLPHSFPHNMSHSMPHSMPHSSTYEKLCTGERLAPCPIPATAGYPSDLDTIAEQRTFRSQACSPTSTWMSDEGEEDLDSITTTTSVTTATVMSTATEPIPVSKTPLVPPLPRSATVAFSVEEDEDSSDDGKIQKSYWSRHFLVDLLAVAIPVVPTVAWLCRGPVRDGQPMYHIGSLLRGCCTVALHSLRRGGGLRHYPAGGGDLGGSQI
uniref:Syntaphilin n=1 Tax=Fundulus heteroclitus TaxID=8078 RepID=A0A3Q2QPT8_FUNHE